MTTPTTRTATSDADLTARSAVRKLIAEKLDDKQTRATIWLTVACVLSATSGCLLTLAALGVDITPAVLR